MRSAPRLLRWLAIAALAEWLISRTLTRAAIYIPKSEAMLTAFRGLTALGQVAATLAGLLALMAVVWIATRPGRASILSLILLALVGLSLSALFLPLVQWTAVAYHALMLAAVAWMLAVSRAPTWPDRVVVLVVTLSLAASRAYLLIASIGAVGVAGASALGPAAFALGEAMFVLLSIVLGLRFGRAAPKWAWAAGAVLTAAFAAMRQAQPAMTGILSMWSAGLSLYLPWPAYAVGLGLGLVGVAGGLRSGGYGWAMVLLAASGFAPQLSTQAFYGLVALWILADPDDGQRVPQAVVPTQREATAH